MSGDRQDTGADKASKDWRRKCHIPSELRTQSRQARAELLKRQKADLKVPLLSGVNLKRLKQMHRREAYNLEQAITYCTLLANARKFRTELPSGDDVHSVAQHHLSASEAVRTEITTLLESAKAKVPSL